ncbi:MAG: hypothetical protein GXY76_10190 [Chloroflexi bacterium]|nr:hypothetical protein [Chloroflexota bacterium]
MKDIAPSGVRDRMLQAMAEGVAARLPAYQERTGRFISEPDGPLAPGAKPEDIGWCVINQDIIYPLALLYTTPGTPYQGDRAILEMALRGGDAVRDFQYPDGQVEFLKVDGSRWGPTYMPWTNYAWLETYALLRDEMDAARRQRWEEGLTLAHDGQAREISNLRVHNIPCWKGMSCYRAGQILGRADWQEAGTAMTRAVLAAQQPGGYWAEHGGPSTTYNYVYVHGLGLYYRFSGDDSLLPALEAATRFHQAFTYPSGAPVETVDGRVHYHERLSAMGWVGFSATPQGRRLVRHWAEQFDPKRDITSLQGGSLASIVLHLIPGDEAPINLDRPAFREPYEDWALVCREGGWFGCLSAFACPPVASRWGQDRQAFLSLWRDDLGLLLGGGNSKDQAEWSSFVANGRLMPERGALLPDRSGVALEYGGIRCLLQLAFADGRAIITASAEGGPALQQLIVQAKAGQVVRSAAGLEATLGEAALQWEAPHLGEWLEVAGCRITLPPGARFVWPTVPFNPYAVDGAAPFGSGLGVLSARIDGQPIRWAVE